MNGACFLITCAPASGFYPSAYSQLEDLQGQHCGLGAKLCHCNALKWGKTGAEGSRGAEREGSEHRRKERRHLLNH